MSGYIIYHYNILDKQGINELGSLSLPILKKYGGELVVGSSVTRLEGSPYTHMVVYKFDSKQRAKAFYEAEESRELSKLRDRVTEGFVVFVPEYRNE
ncbi:hypothetical protein GCM10011352_23810 [Marinobacterium zhoushanense]|uniref:DUF1330 domain-containing protein n=1 Tax=Marinobacterium zhoushanense TaxID=1679163 RepID=A0ABQ1KII0_9GAMM|nr:DUF1330 domain-containing protein [Marinobacterium zhoushanense]GGB96903.1 hypothetical protein GCM10011352_23810 [Marinobacterium zhoushanense]